MTEVEIPVDRVGAFLGSPALLAAGAPDGPLSGIRVAVKDVIDVAGQVTGAGNPTFAARRVRAATHAASVQRLVEAGASVIGKTVLDELAYSLDGRNVHHGTPVNVAAPGHVAGGSSSGSAAAVAAGEADLGLATDTGGSIRVPASYCGLFGWRPTHGSVDASGVVPLAPSFDTVGLLARDAHRLRLGARALLGVSAASTGAAWSLRLVLWAEPFDTVEPPARRAVVDALGELTGTVEPARVEVGLDLRNAADAFRTLQGREAWDAHGDWIRSVEPDFAPDIAARFATASRVTDDEVAAAQTVRTRWRDRLAEMLADGSVLVLPAAAGPAPAVAALPSELAEVRLRTMDLTSPAGLAGLPVVVVPGASMHGLPLGLALVGAPGTDLALLDLVASLHGSAPIGSPI